jgi:acyl-CoA synthetase (AMP-forming)/AMP-acid ligase II
MFFDWYIGALREPLSGRYLNGAAARAAIAARAREFAACGVVRHDRVCLHYGNRVEFFVDIAAAWSLGACAVPLDPRLTEYEVEQLTKSLQPRVSVWDRAVTPPLHTALQAAGAHCTTLGDALEQRSLQDASLPHLDDAALVLLTSGTTGSPKAAVHTHRSLRARWASQRDSLGVDAFERTLCLLPTNFAWGLVGNSLYPWLSGQELIVLPAFRADLLVRVGALCDEHAVTYLPMVPASWRMALRTAAPPKRGTLRRVSSGTGPLPSAVWSAVRKWSGVDDVLTVYGITECGWLSWHSALDGTLEEGVVGCGKGVIFRILPLGVDIEAAADATPLPHGEPGEVWVSTPALMQGYFGRDDLTRQCSRSGWFRTGDIGSLGSHGCLTLRGREKEMINAGGVKVYPTDIDAVIASSNLVSDVCVFGAPDPLHGEQVAVAITLPTADPGAAAAVLRWTRQRLAAYQVPRTWYLVDEIPRTARAKIDRAKVAAHCAALRPIDARLLESATPSA